MKQLESLKRIAVLQLTTIGLLILTAMYGYAWYHFYINTFLIKFYNRGNWLVIAIYGILLFFFSATYGATKVGYLKTFDVLLSQFFALFCANAITYAQLSVMNGWFAAPAPFFKLSLVQLVFSFAWILICQIFYRLAFPPRELLLVSGDRSVDDIMAKFATRKDKYKIVKSINISEGREAVEEEILRRYEGVVLWDMPVTERNLLLKFCYSHAVRVFMMPKIPDVLIRGSEQLDMFDTPILLTRDYALTLEQRFLKRTVDIVCALILTILSSPFMLITAILVKCYDGGPVFYKQVRCTRDEKEFKIIKFRSMRVDAEKDGKARLSSKNDDRITPIGKFIRKVRIDELPQLFNILAGDMTFVGPRPERPEIIEQYLKDMPEFAFRMRVKAGLAGYAQVYGKYNTTPYDKLKLDLTYIEHYSIWLDLKLMLLTLKILFTPDSTEGVEDNQITALKGKDM